MMLEECPLISNFSPLVNETTRMRFPLTEHKIFKLMGSINVDLFYLQNYFKFQNLLDEIFY